LKISLYALFFSLGLNKFYLYCFFLLIYLLFKKEYKKLSFNYLYLLWIILIFISILGIILFSQDWYRLLNTILLLIISLVIIGYIYEKKDYTTQESLLKLFIYGMGFESILIVMFSFIFINESGYGNLTHPFTNEKLNSPNISENISILSTLLIYEILRSKSILSTIIKSALLLLCIYIGIFLASRTFLIVLILAIILLTIKNTIISKKYTESFLFILCVIVLFLVLINQEFLYNNLNFFMNRFEDGIQSKRFEHYQDGLDKILNYPFGGFETNPNIENIKWFHNVYLDFAKLGGWLSSIPLIILSIVVIYQIVKTFWFNSAINILAFVILLIIQQGVVLEGNVRLIIILFFCSICLNSAINKSSKIT
jgi:hypothetical protein